MIPVRLELKNFLPYRAPDAIFFEGIHLACLTGANGAGKSSLLDAITWALWGKARGKRDDDLVHLNQSEMSVQLDFEQEGDVYRVLRRRKAGRRGQGSLDLFSIQTNNQLRTINQPSMRQTQAKINDILRLDYDTFVNSAFLQQGKADAFTTKTPAERKRILSDILGLEQWQVYEERVKARLKKVAETIASLKGAITSMEEEIAREPQYQQEEAAALKAHQIAAEALETALALLEEVQDAPANLRNATAQEISSKRRLKNFVDDLTSVDEEIQQRTKAIEQYHKILNLAQQIESGYQNLQGAREADSTLSSKLREMTDLDKRRNQLQTQLAEARSQLEQEKRDYEATMRENQRLQNGSAQDTLAEVQVQIITLEQLEQERETLNDQIVRLREERSAIKQQQKRLTDEGQGLNERIATLEESEGANCPLCGQALDETHREKIVAELTEERDAKRESYKAATVRVHAILEEQNRFQERIDAIAIELVKLPKLRGEIGALQQQAAAAAAAQSRLEEAQAKLQSLLTTLATEDFAHEIRQQLQDVERERHAVGYDRDAHENIQNTLSEYHEYESQHRELEFAQQSLPREQSALDSALERKHKTEKAIAEEKAALEQLKADIEVLTMQNEEHIRRSQEVGIQRTAVQQASNQVSAAQQQLKALADNRKRKKEYEGRLEAAEHEEAVYQELRQAFGKNGIPAMIIEAAIPELEVAANDWLARMTDGRMHLYLSTQREKISGGTMETLDIEIADELGTRAYEMYSGGEAFRINFAIRVALSKMLARRAGAQLRTLFIDEGFGTQDDDGRNKLVEAITAIQDDFDLVLVITHIDELRDAFPVHLIVEKTSGGSMVMIR